MKKNYTLIARIFPALLVIFPIQYYVNLIINLTLFTTDFSDLIKFFGINVSLGVILLYLFSQLLRMISKSVFERFIFNNQIDFPTTKMLRKESSILSTSYKNRIYEKIRHDFDIDLNDVNTNEEDQTIIDTVSQIRNLVGQGNLLINRNIEYGFMRNLIAGTPFCIIACILIAIKMHNLSVYIFFGLYAGIAFILLVLSRKIINFYASQYANQLFTEYLSKEKKNA